MSCSCNKHHEKREFNAETVSQELTHMDKLPSTICVTSLEDCPCMQSPVRRIAEEAAALWGCPCDCPDREAEEITEVPVQKAVRCANGRTCVVPAYDYTACLEDSEQHRDCEPIRTGACCKREYRICYDQNGCCAYFPADCRDKYWPSFAHPRWLCCKDLYNGCPCQDA